MGEHVCVYLVNVRQMNVDEQCVFFYVLAMCTVKTANINVNDKDKYRGSAVGNDEMLKESGFTVKYDFMFHAFEFQ